MSSYSFGAGRGSEAGVGWNVATGMAARGHEVTVVTTSEFRNLNKPALDRLNLPLQLIEIDAGLSQFNSSQSYRHWQKAIGSELRRLAGKHSYDVVHHITFNQYRSLRDVFEVNLPYVIGPIGGAETVNACFWKELPLKMALKEMVRYVPWDVLPLKKRMRASSEKGRVIASTPQTAERLTRHAGIRDVRLSPIIAVHEHEIVRYPAHLPGDKYFVFDGGTRPEKGMKLMLRALSSLWAEGVRCPVKVAAVAEESKSDVIRYAGSVGLPGEAVELLPFMPRATMLNIVSRSCGFISVGFRDAGCMALLEAVAQGVPALCLDLSGQHWLPAEYAIKVPVGGRNLVHRVAEAMRILACQPSKSLEWHACRADWVRKNMSWEARLDYIENIYQEINNSR